MVNAVENNSERRGNGVQGGWHRILILHRSVSPPSSPSLSVAHRRPSVAEAKPFAISATIRSKNIEWRFRPVDLFPRRPPSSTALLSSFQVERGAGGSERGGGGGEKNSNNESLQAAVN